MLPLLVILLMMGMRYDEIKDVQNKPERIMISEVMAKNLSGLQDVDGDYSDWIEIHNATGETLNLAGYGLNHRNRLGDLRILKLRNLPI